MDLLIDAQCLQSASRERGIGRYTRNLIRGMRVCRPGWRVRLVQLANLPPINQADACGLPVLTFTPPVRVHPFELPTARLNGRYYGDWLCALRPDAILLTSLPGEHQTVAPEFALDRRPHVAAVSYDFIPLAMADWFLRNEVVAAWYRARADLLLAADSVLSLSEHTASDLARFYPHWRGRSEVILGAPDPLFAPLAEAEAERRLRPLATRHGIGGEFLLCCASSPDKHKNVDGAVRAFAALPPDVQARHPLVIAGPVRDASNLHKVIQECGVGDRCHLIGYVSDDDLKALYHGCRLFLCPSIYEGLGLPVLEALQCGAPVVTSTESSLPEVAGGVSWLCDVRTPTKFAAAISTALAEPRDARLSLRLAHARKFNWTRTAEAACRVIETPAARRHPRLAWVTPPAANLAAHAPVDLRRLMDALAPRFGIDLVVEHPDEFAEWADQRVVRFADFLTGGTQYDLVVYTLVDDPSAAFLLPAVTERPGVFFLGSPSLDALVIGTLLRNSTVALPPALTSAAGAYGLQLLASAAVGLIDATPGGLPATAGPRRVRLSVGAPADGVADFLDEAVDDRRAEDAGWVEQAVQLLVNTDGVRAAGDRLLTRWADLRSRRNPDHPPAEPARERAVWVDVSTLFDNPGSYTGITRTTLSVVKAFLEQGRVVGFFRHDAAHGFVGVTRQCVVGLAGNEGTERNAGWKESSLTTFQPDRDDVALFPGFDLGYPNAVQQVWRSVGCSVAFLLYDLIPHKFPQWFVASCGPLYQPWLVNALQAADVVYCISESTRRDLLQFADVNGLVAPPAEVIRLGDGELSEVKPAPKPAFAESLRSGGPGYVLLVSTIEVRKNHLLAYQAWRRLLQRHGPAVVPTLVFAGSVGWMSGDLIAQLENDPFTRGHIRIVSGTSDAELSWLYTHCLFTLYPSLYEGWGLPVAEGLAFGKACVASDASSVPEIAGDLVDYHDPHDLVGYVAQLERLIFDPDYRAARERQVRERFRRTRWTDTAAQMTAAMDRLFGTVDPEVDEQTAEADPPTVTFVDPALKRPA